MNQRLVHKYVTPCVGVWIETYAAALDMAPEIVTPCVGVWIETHEWSGRGGLLESRLA